MRSEGWDEMGNLVLLGFPSQLLRHRSDSGNTLGRALEAFWDKFFAVQSSFGLLVQSSRSGFLSAEITGVDHNAQDEAQEP